MKKWIVGSTIAAAAIASVFFFSTYSLGTTRYVRQGCTNNITTYNPTTNSCTGGTDRVYSSIDNALAANTTVAGDTLFIRAGTYNENIAASTRTIPTGTSWANAPIISAYTGETVIKTGHVRMTASYIKYVIFQNLILDGGGTEDEIISLNNGANHVRFIGCEIRNARRMGSLMPHPGDDFHEFINCNIHHNGVTPGRDHGLYIGSNDVIVDNCDIHHNAAYGIHQYNGYPGESSNRNIYRNNRVYSNGTVPVTDVNPFGILLGSGSDNVAYNNLSYGNTGGGISVGGSGTGNKVYNNTIYGNTSLGFALEINAGSFVRNNIVVNNGLNQIVQHGTSTVSNNLCNPTHTSCQVTGNPNFTSTTAGSENFHILTGSAAINAGCTGCSAEMTAVFTTDKDNVARGAVPWDLGAYEFDTGGGTPSITISSPAGGATWNAGTQQTITWSCPTGCAGPIDINIDRANAGTFTESIIQDYPLASGSSYTWTVTGSGTDNQVKIRVRDNDATPTATTSNFTIQASGGGSGNPIISENSIGPGTKTIPGVSDTWIWQLAPTQNNNADSGLYVNKYDATGHRHQLLKFDGLSQIPSGSTITSAKLAVYVTGGGNGTATADAISQTWDVRRLLRNWDKTQATWNVFSTGNSWTTAGGLGAGTDRVATASAQILNVTSTAPGFFTVVSTSTAAGTLLDDVIKIVNGTNPNYGWHLERNGAGNDTASRNGISSEGTDGQRPYLELVLTTSAPTITVTEPKAGDLFLSGQQGPVRWTSQGISGTVTIKLSRDGGATWETIRSTGYSDADETLTYDAPTSSNCKVQVVWDNDTAILGTSSAFRIGGTRAGFTLVP